MLTVVLTAALIALSLACALGQFPWPQLPLSYMGVDVPDAGMWVQIGLTFLLSTICLLLPANGRMARLERSHRSFVVGLEDVAHAYRLAHAADRAGVFALSGEFEAVRARLEHLRNHPDLAHLEPEILQLAAQMSFVTRDIAHTYSDEKVNRAKGFLRQRQEEVDAARDRLSLARRTVDELRRWLIDVEAEEREVERQIKRLEGDLREVLPQLGYAMEAEEPREATVVQLPKPGK
jgi:chromosome segregation ATPase